MKKFVISLIIIALSLISCNASNEYIEIVKEVPTEIIIEKEVPVEVIVEKEVLTEVIIEKEVPVEIVVEKEILVETVIEKEVPIEIVIEKPVEIIKEIIVEKCGRCNKKINNCICEVETIFVNKEYDILFADNDDYYNKITTKGEKIEYLAVYNCSNNTSGGCYNSYVLGALTNGHFIADDYLNLSCVKRDKNTKYSDYIVNCTNRTSPGSYYNTDWENTEMGTYILTNVEIHYVNPCLTWYGNHQLTQIVLSYEDAYSLIEFILPKPQYLTFDTNNSLLTSVSVGETYTVRGTVEKATIANTNKTIYYIRCNKNIELNIKNTDIQAGKTYLFELTIGTNSYLKSNYSGDIISYQEIAYSPRGWYYVK